MNHVLLILAVSLSLSVLGCTSASDNPQSLPTIRMKVGEKEFTLEVAVDDASRQLGLMNRDSMPADHGMLFVLDRNEVQGFWMKNTRIALDIIFLSPDQKVVSIHSMEPFDLRTTSSDYPAKFAIELNQGAANDAGVKVGDQLKFPELPTSRPTSKPSR